MMNDELEKSIAGLEAVSDRRFLNLQSTAVRDRL
jgi:hypothetical protein